MFNLQLSDTKTKLIATFKERTLHLETFPVY